MATNSSNGVNLGSSSIDVPTIVSNLVNLKKAAPQKALDAKTSDNTTKISAVGNFNSALISLQNALKGFTDGSAFNSQKITIGDNTVLTASADATAKPGNFNVNVTQLATAQKTTSQAYTNANSAVGTGNLTIAVGSKSMSFSLDGTNNTLQNVADKINNSKDNPGVTAAVINGSDGAHLVLTSSATGVANAFTVTSSGGDGNLAALNFNPATDAAKATTQAQDAKFTIDNTPATSASNTVTSAISGVTLTLAKTGPSSVTLANDPSTVTSQMTSLVNAYNSFIGTYQTLTKYDPTNQQVGALIGDATVSSIKSQISNLIGQRVPGNGSVGSLSDLGVSFQVDGTLKLDSTKLTNALTNNPTGVQSLLSGANGIGPSLDKMITSWTGSNGIVTQRIANLNQTKKDLADQQTALDSQMSDYSDRLTKQYTALDTLMTKLQSTSSYIAQQFTALTKSS